MCSICIGGAGMAVASVYSVVFGAGDTRQTGERFLRAVSPPSWLLGWLCCTRALFVVLMAMHYGTALSYSDTHTHIHLVHFLDRKFRPYATTVDTALPCLQTEVKRGLFRRSWVCVFARASLQY